MRQTLLAGSLLVILAAAGGSSAEARIDAVTDRFTTFRGQRLVIRIDRLLDNDVCTRPCRKPLDFVRAVWVDQTQGKLQIRGNHIIFTPRRGFTGVTAFRYVIAGERGIARDRGLVRIRVRQPSPSGRD